MKIVFSLLMFLAAATTALPSQAATKVASYEQAQSALNEDGYLLFIYGEGWDKQAKSVTTELYNNPAIIKAAGKAAMMLVPLPESMNEAEKAAFEKVMGKLQLPHGHSKHSFPAIVMYNKAGHLVSSIWGPPMVYPDARRIALMIEKRRATMHQQNQLLAKADAAKGEERARLLLEACRLPNLERPNRVQQLIKEADPEDKSGCLAALNFHNNPVGDAINKMPILEALAELDKAISNPLHTAQQKQNACAFAIGLIRRRIGTGAVDAICHYARIMRDLDPESVLGRSALIVMRDWTTGLQYSKGWSAQSLPMRSTSGKLYGKLPIDEAGTYVVRFTPEGGKNHAKVSRVELLDGETSISVDDRDFTLTSPASYFVTAPAPVKNPRIRITFDNDEHERDTRGKITITRK